VHVHSEALRANFIGKSFVSVHQNAAIEFTIVTKRVVSYYEVDGYNGEVAERLKAAVC
jgi:hypothetical protein